MGLSDLLKNLDTANTQEQSRKGGINLAKFQILEGAFAADPRLQRSLDNNQTAATQPANPLQGASMPSNWRREK